MGSKQPPWKSTVIPLRESKALKTMLPVREHALKIMLPVREHAHH